MDQGIRNHVSLPISTAEERKAHPKIRGTPPHPEGPRDSFGEYLPQRDALGIGDFQGKDSFGITKIMPTQKNVHLVFPNKNTSLLYFISRQQKSNPNLVG